MFWYFVMGAIAWFILCIICAYWLTKLDSSELGPWSGEE